ncbi:uncharacterized protein DUF4105 [Acetobacteroides hydrogenigenes]|uniref:Uncharacterized protein DUF4105 n=2 Tax=Acetobacteroides hydrogenigenes TaxID=979970 RepID=A0A4R2EM98_9BACT|nr:uncharacterized protein DUF4105 [Acetobacteroides hydrogenigenes]
MLFEVTFAEMIRRLLLVASILLSSIFLKAESYRNVSVSLLTVSPGTELYSLFGHSAIRIQDPLHGIDDVYNFGTFDFDTPNFGLKFVSGRLDYMLALNTFSQVYQSYLWEERAMTEQILNLTSDQKKKIISLLEENYRPENRFYRYAFLDDNCATRIRDVIEEGLSDSTVFSSAKTSYAQLSYRQLLKQFLTNYPWVDLGIDLAIGLPSDKVTNNREKMFLPEYMKQLVEASSLKNGEKLAIQSRSLLTDIKEPFETVNFITPISIFFAILTLSLIGFSAKQFSRIFSAIFYFSLGLLGIVLTLTSFATDHDALRNNLNLLWALPFNIIMFRAAGKKAISKFSRYYFFSVGIIALLLLALWGNFPQQFNNSIIPILLTIVVTSIQISIQRYVPLKEKGTAIKKKKMFV